MLVYESVYNLNQEGQRGSTRGATHAHYALKIGRAVTPLVRDTEGRRSKNAETKFHASANLARTKPPIRRLAARPCEGHDGRMHLRSSRRDTRDTKVSAPRSPHSAQRARTGPSHVPRAFGHRSPASSASRSIMPYVATHHPPATPPERYADPGSERPAGRGLAFRASARQQGACTATKLRSAISLMSPPFENILRGLASENLTIPTFRPRGLTVTRTGPPD